MRKNLINSLLTLILLIVFFIAISDKNSGEGVTMLMKDSSPIPTIHTVNVTQTAKISPSASRNIEVLNPRSGDTLYSGFRILGNARTFENTVITRLYDSNGNILFEEYSEANASASNRFGPFELAINFETESTEGNLEIFQYNPESGKEIDKVLIPVLFKN